MDPFLITKNNQFIENLLTGGNAQSIGIAYSNDKTATMVLDILIEIFLYSPVYFNQLKVRCELYSVMDGINQWRWREIHFYMCDKSNLVNKLLLLFRLHPLAKRFEWSSSLNEPKREFDYHRASYIIVI